MQLTVKSAQIICIEFVVQLHGYSFSFFFSLLTLSKQSLLLLAHLMINSLHDGHYTHWLSHGATQNPSGVLRNVQRPFTLKSYAEGSNEC